MPRFERNSGTLLLGASERLKIADRRQKEKSSTCVGEPVGAAGPAKSGDSISFAYRLFAPEMRAWRGEQPIWLTFWIYGFGVSGFLAIFYAIAAYAATPVLQQVLLLMLGAYTAWVLISLWRCTERARHFFGVLARFLIVPWAANIILVLAFMQIELLPQLFLART